MTKTEVSEVAAIMAALETALEDQGFKPSRVTAILSGAAGQVVANVTGVVRVAETWPANADAA